MPEFIIFALWYLAIGFMFGFVITKFAYKDSIEKNKNPLPKVSRTGLRAYTETQLDELETKRRKKLATEALTTGFWCGVFWIIVLPIAFVLIVAGLTMKLFYHLAIKPTDKPFVSDKEFRKAKAIVEKYDRERINEFDKELNGD